jgi:hypothetical protein
MRTDRQLAWVMAACAAVAAQATPAAVCLACDGGCCKATISGSADQATAAGAERPSGCPLCASHAGLNATEAETDSQPCTCQLDARQDQPLALLQNPPPQDERKGDAALSCGLFCGGKRAASPFPGPSREYEALSLAIPIRPVRILFGVWRN